MPIVSLFPDTPQSRPSGQEDFEREVAARFGLVPNFFRSALDAPLVIRELWRFAKAAYLDTPFPALLRSDYSSISRGFTKSAIALLGLGRPAGNQGAPVMTVAQVIRLLRRPIRAAHYWTLMHPEIELEDDVKTWCLNIKIWPGC